MRTALAFAVWCHAAAFAAAQEPVRLVETFPPDYQYRVSCRVNIDGSLTLPPTKDRSAQSLKVSGKSVIDYHERVLTVAHGKVDKTVRKVHQMEFTRKVGDQDQANKLRADVNLLVIQRLQNLEVPFSPLGPLLWSEIDLVRTDVFTPALAGLLPKAPVKAGATWTAEFDAVKELTDLDKLSKGGLNCTFEGIDPVNPRLARVGFRGVLNGVGEDGPAEHELEGYYLFDVKSQHIGYVSLQGVHRPLNNSGVAQGEIKGTFVLTRDPAATTADLSAAALSRWRLNPTDDNTLLLFEDAGVRFLYPRHWRIDEASARQIRLVERQGSDLLITLDPLAKLPSAVQFHKEARQGLVLQKAQITGEQGPRRILAAPFEIDHFTIEARFGNQPATFDYYIVGQRHGGATLSARYPPAQAAERRREVERLARGLVVNVK
ncbi:MAG: hypothetical protein L0Y71_13810 [Gemmataceae bacterium]|nr:hypothetical protein [Gemmataceae bacterium]